MEKTVIRMEQLATVVQYLSMARSIEAIMAIVRQAARSLMEADGATFVIRDGNQCFYADEDAMSPLWKGQRFPIEFCISGWAMLNRKATAITDIFQDERIPHDAYRSTFVKSLAMAPIRAFEPMGAIGVYWAHNHETTPAELQLLQALANTTAVALENVRITARMTELLSENAARLQSSLEAIRHSSPSPAADDLREITEALGAVGELKNIINVCAWTGMIEYEGEWLRPDEFLDRRFGMTINHTMSQQALRALQQELD